MIDLFDLHVIIRQEIDTFMWYDKKFYHIFLIM